ncbi:HD domain-containing protein [Halocella sp. SP3-1]|uniref:HD domain-containing protein n=1 Tax=Halocella sp. SP3-1 TaxID=2382161 RepID=UPI000F75F772|nr:HD domain-containing protein [Halocella sp. SP3-1]AZO95609.1 bifunctional (p)ppGpp synthetase/guanosine-3',5'-bis(diphosphate) 3'-pyrophosphohydrolase [Halocella sp. SP3-1]
MLRFERAVNFAARAHQGQLRKGTETPYIVHPYMVGMILYGENCAEEVIVAGILHDTIEDTSVKDEDIEKEFDKQIRDIVVGVSEPDKKLPWRVRKEHTINYLREAPLNERLVICADKLHNISSITEEYNSQGEKLWDKFTGKRDEQEWYYQSIVDILLSYDDISNYTGMFMKLKTMVEDFF